MSAWPPASRARPPRARSATHTIDITC
uniref:Uncharacterized protein n=1 Tax=Arundo donax TaxID=35708 RepID=A0A0A9GPL5_ARUDO